MQRKKNGVVVKTFGTCPLTGNQLVIVAVYFTNMLTRLTILDINPYVNMTDVFVYQTGQI